MGDKILLYILCSMFALCAYICLKSPWQLERVRNWFLYDKYSTPIMFGSATAILLYRVFHLSTADFGEYKTVLFVLFSAICALSFFKVRELLSVRGSAILALFFFSDILDAVQAKVSVTGNVFVAIVYALTVAAIAFGAVPYLFRDYLDYLIEHKNPRIITGYLFGISAIIALFVIF